MMKLTKILIISLAGFYLSFTAFGFSYDSNCKAYLDDGKVIDLSPLDNSTNPMTCMIGEASSDYQIFFYNPCTDLICDSGEQGAMCFVSRIDNVTTSGVSALTSNVSLFLDDSGNMVQYYALPKITEIMCQCAENQTSPILQRPSYLPLYILTSRYCCPQTTESGNRNDEYIWIILGIVASTIMLILIGLLFLVRLTKCGKFKKTNSEDDKVGIVNAVYSR